MSSRSTCSSEIYTLSLHDALPILDNTGFFDIFASRPLGLPISAWVMIILAVVFSILLNRTPFGRWLYATGSNERAAQLSGVDRKSTRLNSSHMSISYAVFCLKKKK